MGTFGYMDPVYYFTGLVTEYTDLEPKAVLINLSVCCKRGYKWFGGKEEPSSSIAPEAVQFVNSDANKLRDDDDVVRSGVDDMPLTETAKESNIVDGSGSPGVKEVGWGSFYADSSVNDGCGFGSYSDFFTELDGTAGDLQGQAEVALATGGNLVANATSVGLDNSAGFEQHQGQVQHDSGSGQYVDNSQFGQYVDNSQSWENLYPGWKYDASTGQWYQVDGHDASVNSQESYINSTSNWESVAVDNSDVAYLKQSTTSAAAGTAESVSTWNQVSQVSNGYPEHVIFDAQYPGWYYDTIAQEWRSLDSYNQASQTTLTGHDQQSFIPQHMHVASVTQNGPLSFSNDVYQTSSISLFRTISFSPQVREDSDGRPPHALVSFGFGGKLILYEGYKWFSAEFIIWKSGNWGKLRLCLKLGRSYFWECLLFQSRGRLFELLSLPASTISSRSLVGGNVGSKELHKWLDERILNCESSYMDFARGKLLKMLLSLLRISCQYYGKLRSPFGTDASQKETDSAEAAVAKLFAFAKKDGVQNGYAPICQCLQHLPPESQMQVNNLYSTEPVAEQFKPNAIGAQSFIPQHMNVATVTQNGPLSFSNGVYNRQQSVDDAHQSFQNNQLFSPSAGRSSDGRPPHALVSFGFGGKLILMKDINGSLQNSSFGSQGIGGSSACLKLGRSYFWEFLLFQSRGRLFELLSLPASTISSSIMGNSVLLLVLMHRKRKRTLLKQQSLSFLHLPRKMAYKIYAPISQCLQHLPPESQMQVTASEVQNLLASGRKMEAVQCAQEGYLWGPALVIAAQLGDQFYVDTVKQMALCQLIPGSPLRTLCLLVAGQPAEVCPAGSSSMLDNWEENLGIITANRTTDDELVITHLGDRMWNDRSEIIAAHICYVIADKNFDPYSESARLCLVGADHWKCPRTYASPEAIQRTELYEYSKTLGNSQYILLPFRPFKIIYAHMLAEVGKLSTALKYCQAVLKCLKTGRSPEVEMW
ncbi:unnamed protein product [Arabidopsis arenosa]|uniref:Sec16 Sec23-binding domain-containing protein n=1 Tax=Arabidopsis arenosa TaxID=38785 RepID=A0A8S2B0U8_ARAAE|nr:unnamed protein product [Arabidopsis arenosa]